jgi:hypothetical protein
MFVFHSIIDWRSAQARQNSALLPPWSSAIALRIVGENWYGGFITT